VLFLGTGSGGCSQTSLPNPQGLFYDTFGTLWVSDPTCNRVLGFFNVNSLSQSPPADIVFGQSTFTTSSVNCTASQMNNPRGLFVDTISNSLLVADFSFLRITSYSLNGAVNGANATSVIGQPDFTTCGARATDTTTLTPFGLFYDFATVGLLVGCSGENRVVRLNCPAGFPIIAASNSSSVSTSFSATLANTVTATGSASLSVSPTQSGTASNSRTPSKTPSGTPTGTQLFICGNGITETNEKCDPGVNNFGDANTCCNLNCNYKHRGEKCNKPVNSCTRSPRCSGRGGINPGVCLPGKPKRTGVTCQLTPGIFGKCNGLGTCIL